MAKTRFHTILDAKLKEVLDGRKEELSSGSAGNIEQYRFQLGYMRAIRDVIAICDEINEDFDK